MPTPICFNGIEAKHGDIHFFGGDENPTRVCMLVLYNEENDYWDIKQISHDVARGLNAERFEAARKAAWASEAPS